MTNDEVDMTKAKRKEKKNDKAEIKKTEKAMYAEAWACAQSSTICASASPYVSQSVSRAGLWSKRE